MPLFMKSKSRIKTGLGIAISIVCLWLTFRQVSLVELATVLKLTDWKFILLGVGSLAIGYLLRIWRWAILLRTDGSNIRTISCAAPFLGSITLNNVLPFRTGDFVRALIFPKAMGIARTEATASLLLERLTDLLALLIGLGVGLFLNTAIQLPVWLKTSVIYLSLCTGGGLVLLMLGGHKIHQWLFALQQYWNRHHYHRLAIIFSIGVNFTSKLIQMTRLHIVFPILIISMFVWLAEAGLFWFFMKSLHLSVSTFSLALFVMTIATLATLVPSSPGYIGSFHFAVAFAVTLFGIEPAQAASLALLTHLGVWLPTTLAGGMALLHQPSLFDGITVRS
ncbi:MAG: flippase-like domain-containing protein [Legionellales bacterium]|nr:flippase-like domain-containing protein [Legionellales bacterium]